MAKKLRKNRSMSEKLASSFLIWWNEFSFAPNKIVRLRNDIERFSISTFLLWGLTVSLISYCHHANKVPRLLNENCFWPWSRAIGLIAFCGRTNVIFWKFFVRQFSLGRAHSVSGSEFGFDDALSPFAEWTAFSKENRSPLLMFLEHVPHFWQCYMWPFNKTDSSAKKKNVWPIFNTSP